MTTPAHQFDPELEGPKPEGSQIEGSKIEGMAHGPDNLHADSSTAARAQLVSRTHRVVRERAQTLSSQRSRRRGLWIPMTISAAFLVILCTAIWALLDQYELTLNGVPDASSQILLFLLWFFPVSAAILALAWAHRSRIDRGSFQ